MSGPSKPSSILMMGYSRPRSSLGWRNLNGASPATRPALPDRFHLFGRAALLSEDALEAALASPPARREPAGHTSLEHATSLPPVKKLSLRMLTKPGAHQQALPTVDFGQKPRQVRHTSTVMANPPQRRHLTWILPDELLRY